MRLTIAQRYSVVFVNENDEANANKNKCFENTKIRPQNTDHLIQRYQFQRSSNVVSFADDFHLIQQSTGGRKCHPNDITLSNTTGQQSNKCATVVIVKPR
ncbi:conserved hypothetical protein [Trichinella spiralis]|uniref:hypothetical protein n=1 Tax=Trichinella spiralis TaxID=6334 RepID=UPI0001EFE692|nr:conserved hypothetical protein [Trichinella spiralis]